MQNAFRNLVVIVCLLAMGAFAAWVYLRPQIPQGDRFSAGEQSISARSLREEVRLALWSEPEIFSEELQSGDVETDPFLDEESGRIYFTLGGQGEGQNLWVAEPDAYRGLSARPLSEINSTADDNSPSVHRGYLYFSSNRGGGTGGFDLYRSRIGDNEYLEPEPLRSLNSEADDVDPSFQSDNDTLYFASNRDRVVGIADFDIFAAKSDRERFGTPKVVDGIASPYDERAPTLDAGGHILVFASDRRGGEGGFDLYRVFDQDGSWFEVENLRKLNTEADEWGPDLGDDGFTLVFSSNRDEPRHDLFIARTRELLALPGDGFSLLDFTILFVLLLIAMLAYLARRWEALDIIYKCVLISLILHLLFLWLSKSVEIESTASDIGPGTESYEVQLLHDVLETVASMEDRQRGDSVEVPERAATQANIQRAHSSLAETTTQASAMQPLERLETTDKSAPLAKSATAHKRQKFLERSAQDPVELLTESYEKISGARPSMQLATNDNATPAHESVPAEAERAATPTTLPERNTQHAASAGNRIARADVSTGQVPRQDRTSEFAPSANPTQSRSVAVTTPNDSTSIQRQSSPAFQPEVTAAADVVTARDTGETPVYVVPDVSQSGRLETPAQTPSDPLARASTTESMQEPVRRTSAAMQSPSATPTTSEVAVATPADMVAVPAKPSTPTRIEPGNALANATAPPRRQTATSLDPAAMPVPDMSRSMKTTPSSQTTLDRQRLDTTAAPERNVRSLDHGQAPARQPDSPAQKLVQLNDRVSRESATAADPSANTSGLGLGLEPSAIARSQTSDTADAPKNVPLTVASADTVRGQEPTTLSRVSPSSLWQQPQRNLDTGKFDPTKKRRTIQTPKLRELMPDRIGSASSLPENTAVLANFAAEPTAFSTSRPRPSLKPKRASVDVEDRKLLKPATNEKPLDLAPLELPKMAAATERPERIENLYSRRSGDQKQVALRQGGGSAATERAVLSGLRYLASVQRNGGYFGDARDGSDPQKYRDIRAGKTGLALLAFLGAGHTHQSDSEFSYNVDRALAWLLQQQDSRSGHFGESDGYGHGIATYAVAECYAMTKDRRLLSPLMNAVRQILAVQTRDSANSKLNGGWRYYYSKGPGFDAYPRASLSSWQVMALESAKAGGLPVPEEAVAASRSYFRNNYDRRYGYFRYNHDPSWLNSNPFRTLPASTPASMFVLYLLGDYGDERLETSSRYVMDRLPRGFRYRGTDAFATDGVGNIYFWYYATLALFMRGGSDWELWNEAMKDTLLGSQNRDGSWDGIGYYAQQFAGDDSQEKTYTTAMGVLTLEVYYRYFTPLLQRQGR